MKSVQLKQYCCLISVAVLFFSCTSNEIGQSKDVNQETIYQFYRLEYDENENEASIYAQFRFAGQNGTTLTLNNPSGITFNTTTLQLDSSEITGAFYQATIPLSNAIGKHSLVFTNTDKKKYENSFSVDSFYLLTIPTAFSKRAPAQLQFKAPALQGDDYIRLKSEGTDSSFTIIHKAAEQGSFLTIPAVQLSRQKMDEIFVIPTLYRKINLEQQTREGGEIITIQTLKPVKLNLVEEAL